LGFGLVGHSGPETYLCFVIERIADHPVNHVAELLSWEVGEQTISSGATLVVAA
jgi:hypothetical protein